MLKKLEENQYPQFYQLMEDSFPVDERRPLKQQQSLLLREDYTVYIHEIDGEIAGFLAIWETSDFVFLEHFAVNTTFRNRGLGSKLIQALSAQIDKPIVIEIEPLEGDLEKRRAAFYERNGFHLSHYGYIQPPLAQGLKPVPLVLMSYPNPLSQENYTAFNDWVFSTVYLDLD
ncbi:GNAT family N-acetyltransferase [Bacillus sp. JCM 19041]|uniref:GNAT family N-acetyltransferase n=1 Tax=Bacillus sp. JCM 19041 TaxID=1460637 RepID=UPI0018D0858C